jgi:hypothetical protein
MPFWMVNDDGDDEEEEEDEDSNVGITEDEAIRFVDGLERVSVDAEGLPPHCIVCWVSGRKWRVMIRACLYGCRVLVDMLWVVIAL